MDGDSKNHILFPLLLLLLLLKFNLGQFSSTKIYQWKFVAKYFDVEILNVKHMLCYSKHIKCSLFNNNTHTYLYIYTLTKIQLNNSKMLATIVDAFGSMCRQGIWNWRHRSVLKYSVLVRIKSTYARHTNTRMQTHTSLLLSVC